MAGPTRPPARRGEHDPDGRFAARRNLLTAIAFSPVALGAAGHGRTPSQDDEPPAGTPPDDGTDATTTTAAEAETTDAAAGRPAIRPREDWGSEAPPGGDGVLRTVDTKLLVIHHTEAPEGAYEPSEVAGLIEGIHAFHTSETLGWPDIGFNFIVDEFGTIWEGRQGSIDAAIACEIEGGDPGHTQHCAFLGNFGLAAPTPLATEAMVSLLAWLANRDNVPTEVGATTDFLSEGNDLFPAGQKVAVRTIAGHRDIAEVGCPGDATQAEVVGELQGLVTGERQRIGPGGATGGATTGNGATTLPPAQNDDDGTTTSAFETTPVTRREVGFEASPLPEGKVRSDLEGNEWAPAAITGGVAAAALAAGGAYLLARRRRNRPAALPERTSARAALAGGAAARAAAEARTVEHARALVIRPEGLDGGSAGWLPAGEPAAVGWAISPGWSDDAHDQALRVLRSLTRDLESEPERPEGRAFGDAVTAALTALVAGSPGAATRAPGEGPGAVIFLHSRRSTSVVRLGSGGFVLPGEEERPAWVQVKARLPIPAGGGPGAPAEVTTLARQWRHPDRMPVAVAWLGPTGDDAVMQALTTAHDGDLPGKGSVGSSADDTVKVGEALRRAGVDDLALVVL
ncbi:MAG: N-acetylmuramoyl-L-alanine amidase [Microthrixaceae bacterium]